MSTPVTVKAGNRAQFSINGQSLIVVAFLVILAYVLFAGGKREEQKHESHAGAAPQHDGDQRIRSSLPNTPRSGGTIGSEIASPLADMTPQSQKDAGLTPIPSLTDWSDARYDPSTLRSLTPNAPHTPIVKRPGTSRRASVHFKSDDDLTKTHPDDMMRGGGAGNEADYRAWKEAAHREGRWNPQPPPTPNRIKNYKISQDLQKSSADDLFKGFTLRPGLVERLIEIEDVAKQDNRGTRLEPWPRGKNVKRGIKPDKGDVEFWDDPNADEWDDVWGTLPKLAYEAAYRIAEHIQQSEIDILKGLMEQRRSSSVQDERRSWSKFVARSTAPDKALDPVALAVGWFADTFRAVEHSNRMCISHEFVDTRTQLPLVSNALQWLEALAWHLRRQRLFSDTGLDLHGLSLRLAIPTRMTQSTVSLSFQYELELHVFMWGGPTDQGEDTMENWARRLVEQCQPSLRSAVTDLAHTLHELGETEPVMTLCQRRRVIFRPGYTVQGVSQSSFAVDKSIALREPFSRRPVIVEYPADPWAALGDCYFDEYIRKIMFCVYPQEAGIFNVRQYQWDRETLTENNSRLNNLHLLAILRCIGPALEPESKIAAHTIEFVDFGCFIPLLVDKRQGDDSVVRFFPLSNMLTVMGICIPFLSSQSPPIHGETVPLLLDERYGLRSQLITRQDGSYIGTTKEGLTVFITTAHKAEAEQFRNEIVKYMLDEARLIVASRTGDTPSATDRNIAKQSARVEMKRYIDEYISHICVVDESKSDDSNKLYGSIESEPLEVPGPDEWPAEFQDV